MKRVASGRLIAFFVISLVAACRAPTEITVVVRPNELCAPGKPELRVAFTAGPHGTAESAVPNAVAVGCPLSGSDSLVYVPSGSKSASIDLKILAARGKDPSACEVNKHDSDCIWQRRALSFLPQTPLTVTIDLASACLGIPCDEDTTCNPANGECIAKDVPVPVCNAGGCDSPGDGGADATLATDAATEKDGAVGKDVAVDAPIDGQDEAGDATSAAGGSTCTGTTGTTGTLCGENPCTAGQFCCRPANTAAAVPQCLPDGTACSGFAQCCNGKGCGSGACCVDDATATVTSAICAINCPSPRRYLCDQTLPSCTTCVATMWTGITVCN